MVSTKHFAVSKYHRSRHADLNINPEILFASAAQDMTTKSVSTTAIIAAASAEGRINIITQPRHF
jgi:hypothetical protein